MKDHSKDQKRSQMGIDISLIESTLRLTPAERLRRNDRVLSTARKMRKAMEKKRSG